MGRLTYFAVGYGVLFLLSLLSGNYWMSLIAGAFGVFLILVISARLDAVHSEITEADDAIWKELATLKNEMERITPKQAEMGSPKNVSPEEAELEEKRILLENAYRSKLILYPIENLNLKINEKIESGKTRKQALEELYEEETAKHK